MRVRLTHLVQFSTRAMTRTAFRGVSMLAALGAVSLTVLYANPFSITIRSGPGVTFVANRQCGVPLRSSAFTAADFAAAQAGASAVVVTPYPGWISSLPADPQAKWIAVDANRSDRSALFAQRFDLPCRPLEGSVQLTFYSAVDDFLGDPASGQYAGPNISGVYINGVPLNISAAGYGSQHVATVSVPSSILNPGANYLYVYMRDAGCGVSGVIYSATLRGVCPACMYDNEQPWNKCLPSTPSAVLFCGTPSQQNALAAIGTDDFVATYTGPVNTVEWWGTLSHPSQRKRPFQITIFRQGANCRPPSGDPVYRVCVVPSAKFVGYDCNGKRVWHFRAYLPAPYFNQVAGQKYWLMITEIDRQSIRPGQTDFEWSGHAACQSCAGDGFYCNCRAIKFTFDGSQVYVNPVLGCQGEITDLAWALRWRTHIKLHTGNNPPHAARVRIRLPNSGPVLEEQAISGDADSDGEAWATLATSLPEGEYELEVLIDGSLPMTFPITLDGSEVEIDLSSRVLGDLNGDGSVDDADLLVVLFNFGAGR
jgi:hypothetical protein